MQTHCRKGRENIQTIKLKINTNGKKKKKKKTWKDKTVSYNVWFAFLHFCKVNVTYNATSACFKFSNDTESELLNLLFILKERSVTL